jgi:prepilin-type N-terminal cleavage/methylation domain-containing protein
MMPERGFSLLEMLLALAVVAMVMAAIGPALVGTLRAQRQVHAVLEPLTMEQAAFAVLRDDLLAAPRPDASVETLSQPLIVTSGQAGGLRADTLQLFTNTPPSLHPNVAVRVPEVGQAVVTWTARLSEDHQGLVWTRRRQVHLLATGTAPTPIEEVMLDHLAHISIEPLVSGEFATSYDSDDAGYILPRALRISYAYLDRDGIAGPIRVVVLDLPQVPLDPTQMTGGS